MTESKLASREALNGLGNDLSAQLVHESSGLFARFESERNILQERISQLKALLNDFASKDEFSARNENQVLRKAIFSFPDFRVLKVIQNLNQSSYSQLAETTGLLLNEAIATEALSIILLITITTASLSIFALSDAISAIFQAN